MKIEQVFRKSIIDSYNVDVKKNATAAGVIRELQEAAYYQMKTQRPSYDHLLSEGKALMISRMDLEIIEPIRLDDEITTSSWPCPSTRSTFLRCYGLWKDGKLMAKASSQWALVEVSTRRILKVTDVDFSQYYIGPYEELYPKKLKFSQEEEAAMEVVGGKGVRYSDIDYNGHMNNTYYIDMLCDYIPELSAATHRVHKVRIHFSKEAPLGDAITIKRACPEAGKYIFQTIKASGEINIQAEIDLVQN